MPWYNQARTRFFVPLKKWSYNHSYVEDYFAKEWHKSTRNSGYPQDLEAIVHALDILPAPVFDTQIAVGITHNIKVGMSYHDLVLNYCEVDLTRDQTRTQWDLRPLTSEQLKYAYDDVHYLIPAYKKLMEELTNSNELNLLKTNLTPLTERERYEPSPEMAWKKVKGYKKLRGSSKQLLKTLAKMRELIAIQRDLPKRWIIKDEYLIHLSERYAKRNSKLYEDYAITSYNENLQERMIQTIEKFWERGADLPDNDQDGDNEA